MERGRLPLPRLGRIRAARLQPEHPARREHRHRRHERIRQVDARAADGRPAPADRRIDPPSRQAARRMGPGGASLQGRTRASAGASVQRLDRGQHPLRPPGRPGVRHARSGRQRLCGRLRRRAAGGLRHPARAKRRQPVRRPAAAAVDRAHAPAEAGAASARRQHERRRRRHGDGDHRVDRADGRELHAAARLAEAGLAAPLRRCDRIVVLDEGRLAAVGTQEQLLASSPLYRELDESQKGAEPA